jgi:asparagine synthase (glutamine-hydrolysing)
MCGIAGIWNASVEQPTDNVAAMLDAMRHRGPDGRGTLSYPGGAAGMVRLALVDLSDRGQQPLWSADRKVAILFNGEIYNFREERARLEQRGYKFATTTDTEVILNLYLDEGPRFVDRLRGMYAIAMFDWREASDGVPSLLLVRGPLGIKPLYVAQANGNPRSLVFSSEVRALLASGLVARNVDRQGLADFLAHGFLPQPRTLIDGVRMIEPGTWEKYAPGKPIEVRTFYSLPAYEPRSESFEESAERLRAVLEESVRLHALADAPIGAFLSGGVDSTGIVALMRRHIPHLRTYTLRYTDVPGYDESDEAEAAARQYDCNHTVVELTGREIAPLLPEFAAALDQPSTDGLNTWLISRAAAEDVTGVLSGLGGDEWFAGYPVVRRMAHLGNSFSGGAKALAGQFANRIAPWLPAGSVRERAENLAARRNAVATWTQTHTVFRPQLAQRMVGLSPGASFEASHLTRMLGSVRADWRSETPLGLACLLDARMYMCNQLLRDSDATSMSHSLELRVPLVDREVVNFSRSCRDDYKLHPTGGDGRDYQASGAKRVLIHALRDLLPAKMDRRPKRGFMLPLEHWMRKEFLPLVDDTCSADSLSRRGLIDPESITGTRRAARAGEVGNYYPKLWAIMIFELWCREVLDSAPRATSSLAGAKAG